SPYCRRAVTGVTLFTPVDSGSTGAGMNQRTQPSPEAVEHQLLPIPDEARTSTAAHQFWIWAGANLAPINWVLGALGIGLGLGLADTITVLVLGNIVGMAA